MNAVLDGRTVLVPGGSPTTAGAEVALRVAGARPLVVPLREARPVREPQALDEALLHARRREYEWLVTTSPAGVRALDQRCSIVLASEPVVANLLGLVAVAGLRTAAAGRSTAGAMQALGISPLVPERGTVPAALIGPLRTAAAGQRVLLARGDTTGPGLAGGLRGSGVEVDEVVAYVTDPGESLPADTMEAWTSGAVDAALLTSPQAVWAAVDRLGPPPASMLVACLDVRTALVARTCGVRVDAVASVPTAPDLVRALAESFPAVSVG